MPRRKQDWTPHEATPGMRMFVYKANELVNDMNSLLVLWRKLEESPGNEHFIDLLNKTYPFHLSFDDLFRNVQAWNWEMTEFVQARREL